MTTRELEQKIRALLSQALPDAELRARLEELAAAERSFAGFTWLWGPELYRRNRILFRPFILSRFSTFLVLPKWRVERVRWKGARAPLLEAWLTEVDGRDDTELFRRLYEWKLTEAFDWRGRDKRAAEIRRELLRRFKTTSSPAHRQLLLRKFDLWFELDEESAVTLYGLDPRAAGPFILRHLETGWLSGEPKRRAWPRLLQLAEQRQDEEFRWKLYRRQIPLTDWTREALGLCDHVREPAALAAELEKRHPEGWGVNLAEGFHQLVQRRGRDVFPYVMRHLRQVWGSWFGRGAYGKMADLARERGWWDLWSALIRVCGSAKEFSREVRRLLDDTHLPATEVRQRLLALTGVSREWNWGGLGVAAVHALDEAVALALYERFPDLLRGPFKLHVQSHLWGEAYTRLLDKFVAARDEDMIDYLASRLATRSGRWGQAPKMVAEAEKAADYYSALKADEALFCRRAARVLGQIPAYSIWNYPQLIRENRLARLLFERSAAAYLAEARSMADLVEGSEIHVMALAYRALGLDDDRARHLAGRHLPLLLGTLLRPMQRATRLLAFGALANAAGTAETARLILERARDALRLPDARYPKEQLLGLIAQLLQRWPELRGPAEHPVVYTASV